MPHPYTWCITGADMVHSQGVVSITLVMPQFLEEFPEIDSQNSGASFKKGLLTAMIELGAFLGTYTRRVHYYHDL